MLGSTVSVPSAKALDNNHTGNTDLIRSHLPASYDGQVSYLIITVTVLCNLVPS